MLLETTYITIKNPSIEVYEYQEQFNISIAKLKKTFKFDYLIYLLIHDDAFIKNDKADDKS